MRIEKDKLIRNITTYVSDGFTHGEVVMTKEEFLAAYNAWIKEPKNCDIHHSPSKGDIYKDRIDGQPVIVISSGFCIIRFLAEDGFLLKEDIDKFKSRYNFVTKSSLIDKVCRKLKQNYWDELKEEK